MKVRTALAALAASITLASYAYAIEPSKAVDPNSPYLTPKEAQVAATAVTCDNEKLVEAVKSMKLTNTFGVPITILAIKEPHGFKSEFGDILQCSGIGYTSVGVRGVLWRYEFLDQAKTQPYLSVELF